MITLNSEKGLLVTHEKEALTSHTFTLARCGHFCTDAFTDESCCLCEGWKPYCSLCGMVPGP